MSLYLWILYSLLFVPISYIVWIFIHEYSHILMVKYTVDYHSYHIDWIPVIKKADEKVFLYFARATWFPRREATREENMSIHNAPRNADIIGMAFFVASALLYSYNKFLFFPLAIITGGSVIDMLVGIFSGSKASDIVKYCEASGIPELAYRIIYFLFLSIVMILFFFYIG